MSKLLNSELQGDKNLIYDDALNVYKACPVVVNNLKVKLLNNTAKAPTKANTADGGFDLYINDFEFSKHGAKSVITYKFGIAVEIPVGYVGLLVPRSSIYKGGTFLANSVGVIDAGYRGEIMAKFYYEFGDTVADVGDRVVQLVILELPRFSIDVVDALDSNDRGGGFGSSGV